MHQLDVTVDQTVLFSKLAASKDIAPMIGQGEVDRYPKATRLIIK